ncbi:T9SS type A sorting domain-containing protein [Arcicella sp. DC2W]|uniref:T9SS type A sorting domain-containing protein n=1 Tax=Arcicella gelida TaxID=2984195 RepID=A0ABU5S3M1_9BACT|nr:T9SS type A sorting domain-containing protein [Arcicella sp. DC2W]MEA5402986.1 T9SS type A sorting domain-containing protein [Arcicella sp. DC2W]
MKSLNSTFIKGNKKPILFIEKQFLFLIILLFHSAFFRYPNQTTFSLNFDNPIEQNISLDLIDITGQTVNLFTNERYKEGKYSKTLDVSNMLSGTYMVKLSSDIASATTKLVISK